MIRALLDNNFELDVIVSNLSERGISSSDIVKRLEKRYSGASFTVRKHPSLLDKSKSADRKKFNFYKITLLWDRIVFNTYRVHNFKLMPYNIRNTIKNKMKNINYDIVYCNYLYNVPNFLRKSDTQIISDIHDLQYRRIENDIIPFVNPIESFLYKTFFRSSELKRLKLIDKIISISLIETKMIKKMLPTKEIITIPATTDNPNSIDCIKAKYDITFIGSNSDANRDSLLWFLDNCLSELINSEKRIKFLIQGKIVRNKSIKTNEIFLKFIGKNIIANDYVEHLSDIYDNTKIIICPIIKGSGMKIKVIEALSYSKAIVGTNIAFEGININNNNASIANTDKEFISKVLKLLINKQKRKKIQLEAFQLFKNEHSFDTCCELIKKTI